jgi:hypothetical protein
MGITTNMPMNRIGFYIDKTLILKDKMDNGLQQAGGGLERDTVTYDITVKYCGF